MKNGKRHTGRVRYWSQVITRGKREELRFAAQTEVVKLKEIFFFKKTHFGDTNLMRQKKDCMKMSV